MLRKRIVEQLGDRTVDLRVPEPASDQDILRVHDPEYIRRLLKGELTAKEIRRVGLPWSPQIVRRARYSVGGTIAACRLALYEGIAVNLGGGYAPDIRDIVDIHLQTILSALEFKRQYHREDRG